MKAVACAFNQGVSIFMREEPLGIIDEHMQDWINEKQDETSSSGHEIDIDSVKLV